jgi:hypothetical protein
VVQEKEGVSKEKTTRRGKSDHMPTSSKMGKTRLSMTSSADVRPSLIKDRDERLAAMLLP